MILNKKIMEEIYNNIKKNYKKNISRYYNNFILVNEINFEKSNEVVFVDEFNDFRTGEKKTKFKGLKQQQLFFQKKFEKLKKPIYLIDNHNKALYPFFELSTEFKKNGLELNVVHIDAHRDNAIFQYKYPEEINWKKIKKNIKKSRVSDYLDLAQKTKIIKEVLNITQSYEFDNFFNKNFFVDYKNNKINISNFLKEPYILNLDIDIFGLEGEMINDTLKRKVIRKAWNSSIAVVIAMSPGFIERKKAQEIIKKLISEM